MKVLYMHAHAFYTQIKHFNGGGQLQDFRLTIVWGTNNMWFQNKHNMKKGRIIELQKNTQFSTTAESMIVIIVTETKFSPC